jgi:GNAT superfamily N-acetyltransferase
MRILRPAATARGPITIIHDALPADVATRAIFPSGWSMTRTPALLRTILQRLAADPQARLTLAVAEGFIVGRAAVAQSFGRWATLSRVREYGIEVVRDWRRTGVGARLAEAALTDPRVEQEILLAFALPAAWDIEHARLSRGEYGRLLAEQAGTHGFRPSSTDEPEVMFQAGAALLVRRGARVPGRAVAAFERARYQRRPVGGRAPSSYAGRAARRIRSLLRVGGRGA